MRNDFCRQASTKTKPERGIYVKHFRNIPMADMEIVFVSYICRCLSLLWFLKPSEAHALSPSLSQQFMDWWLSLETLFPSQPEKKNPGLTPMDWVKFLVSAIVGLVRIFCFLCFFILLTAMKFNQWSHFPFFHLQIFFSYCSFWYFYRLL